MTTVSPPICGGCTHLHGDLLDPKCDAFPAGIPNEILLSKADHRQPYVGDKGIRFDPKTPQDAEYADFLFEPAQAS